jgi:hypothetical protein
MANKPDFTLFKDKRGDIIPSKDYSKDQPADTLSNSSAKNIA